MEMCPYCGEDVPADSEACWKCGTELAGEGGGGGEGGEGGGAIELRRGGQGEDKAPAAPCPHCGKVVSNKALRCNGCGKPLQRAGAGFNWAKAVWASFAVVVVATVVGLVYAKAASHVPAPDPGRDRPLAVSFDHLARIYLRPAPSKQLEREVSWESEHQEKYVEWQGVITRVDAEAGRVDIDQGTLAVTDEVDVRLELEDPAAVEQQGLKRGKMIKYSARLIEYRPDPGLFVLDNALILDD